MSIPLASIAGFACLMLASMRAQTPTVSTVVNAADYKIGFAPGGFVSVFGSDLSQQSVTAFETPLPVEMGGTSVEIRDGARTILAPLYYVSPIHISAQLPFDLGQQAVLLTVIGRSARSGTVELRISRSAPRVFTFSQLGVGSATLYKPNGVAVTPTTPATAGDILKLYLNSAGPVVPGIAAGELSGDDSIFGPIQRLQDPVQVTVMNRSADVSFAGLAPLNVGLYQMDFRVPYSEVEGDLPLSVKVGESSSQSGVFFRITPNGSYFVIPAGKAPNGQTFNGLSGNTSAIAYRHNSTAVWGTEGFQSWTKNTGLPAIYSEITGIALTLKNGPTTVYDNNGIDTGMTSLFYDNAGAGDDRSKPGLLTFYSNSVRSPLITAGYFRLAAPMEITELIGYFEVSGIELRAFPFQPDNVFNSYRMNIWSNVNGLPRQTAQLVGDVFSSETVPGEFAHGPTPSSRVFSRGLTNTIYRLSYTTRSPFVLAAGDYWFSHDLAVPIPTVAQPSGQVSDVRVANNKAEKEMAPLHVAPTANRFYSVKDK